MKIQFITDDKGNKTGVVIPIKKYKQILEELEEMADTKLYDEVKALNEPAIPLKKAFKKLEAKRSRNV